MKIRVNGEQKEIRHNHNIYDLLTPVGFNPQQAGIAIAVNREVIPKTQWQQTKLHEGCEVEIIRAVQGG